LLDSLLQEFDHLGLICQKIVRQIKYDALKGDAWRDQEAG